MIALGGWSPFGIVDCVHPETPMSETLAPWFARAGLALFLALATAALANILTQDRNRVADTKLAQAKAVDTAASPAATATPAKRLPKAQTLRDLQQELAIRGYESGASDGTLSLALRAAVLAYEFDSGATLTGEPGEGTLKMLLFSTQQSAKQRAAPAVSTGSARTTAGDGAEQVIRATQAALIRLGHLQGRPTGRLDAETSRGITAFELSERLPASGRPSGTLVVRFERLASLGRLSQPR
jgi:peptidoglycan hydrolase-like protein with peptidoglycan-binding domain